MESPATPRTTSTIGATAYGFHEGARSEYLAQYALSAFGTALLVPRQEDVGIDLHCTLGERKGKRLHARASYFVQVKSNATQIVFDERDAIDWLFDLRYPLLVCVVSKAERKVRLFQTTPVVFYHARKHILRITIDVAAYADPFVPPDHAATEAVVATGKPILDFQVEALGDPAELARIGGILSKWLELDQFNIDLKRAGSLVFTLPESYETNQMPSAKLKSHGNFRLVDVTAKDRLHEHLLRHLAILVLQAASGDLNGFVAVADSAGRLVNSVLASGPVRISPGLELFAIAINGGAARHGLDMKFEVHP